MHDVSFENFDASEIEPDELPEIQTAEVFHDYQAEETIQDRYFSFTDEAPLVNEFDAVEASTIDEDQIHESVLELMAQLGCQEELSEVEEEHVCEEFLDENAFLDQEEREATEYAKTEEMCREYQKRNIHSLVSLISLAVVTLLLFFYDTLPMMGVEFAGILSYLDYPGAYLMIGFQLVLIGAIFLGKPLLTGMRRIFSIRPDLYSVIALMILSNFTYDLILLLSDSSALPTFHFLTALMMFSVSIGEHVLLVREMKIFSVYTMDAANNKYTLLQSSGKNSVAEQMYRAGVDENKKIYSPVSVEYPEGFLSSIREEIIGNRVISLMMLPVMLLSILALLTAILLQQKVNVVALTWITVIFSSLPLNAVAAICIPLCTATAHLQKRGIAITGKRMIDHYAEGDTLVYHDLHLFKPCDIKDTGIVFYEAQQTENIIGALELLYSTIQGPMKDVFSEIPESYRFKKIRIRRIFRNGIEAFVEKKHILLVGDAAFMKNYGLSFPMEETGKGRSTLCISLNGKVSAKMSVKYTTEPIFEMLVERLYAHGIQVVVETFDPMIHASLVASARRLGNSPISVFHKNVAQLHQKESKKLHQNDDVGILAINSRLKLAEALIWCKRLLSIRRWNNVLTFSFCVLGLIFSGLALALGWMTEMNQYTLLLFAVLPHAAVLLLTFLMIPKKKYFSIQNCRKMCQKKEEKQLQRSTKQQAKAKKKRINDRKKNRRKSK